MKTLAKYHVCNRYVIGGKTFNNILIGPGKLPGLSRNAPQEREPTANLTAPGVFLRVLRFSSFHKNQHFHNSSSTWEQWTNSHSVDVPLKFPFILFYFIF